jgi:hypothetical protein
MMDIGFRNQAAVESFFNICKIEPPIHEKIMETKKKEQLKKKEEVEKANEMETVLTYESIQKKMEERDRKGRGGVREDKLSMRALFYNYEVPFFFLVLFCKKIKI